MECERVRTMATERIDQKAYVVACKRGLGGEEEIYAVCASTETAIDCITNALGLEQIIPRLHYVYAWEEPKPEHDVGASWEESRLYARIVPCTLREIERGSDDS